MVPVLALALLALLIGALPLACSFALNLPGHQMVTALLVCRCFCALRGMMN